MGGRLVLVEESDLAVILKGSIMAETMLTYHNARSSIEQAVNHPELQLEYVAKTMEQAHSAALRLTNRTNPWISAARAVLKVPK